MTRRPRILIRGAGVAGLTAAKLLRDRGADVRISTQPHRGARIVAIPIETVALAAELFDVEMASLFVGPIVDQRRVDWSAEGPAVQSQVALVCNTSDLAAVLALPLRDAGCLHDGVADDDVDWIIEASGRASSSARAAGHRVGQFARVLGSQRSRETTVMAIATGWIFTAPHPEGGLAVLLVSPSERVAPVTADDVVERLTCVGIRVSASDVVELGRAEPAAPALAQPLHTDARLSIGDAALALDPLGGDGLGFALRGALLAQAVVAAIIGGSDRELCLRHYTQRLHRVFLSHLNRCCEYHRIAHCGTLWEHEVAAMNELAARLEDQVSSFDFRIEGHDLVRVPAASRYSVALDP